MRSDPAGGDPRPDPGPPDRGPHLAPPVYLTAGVPGIGGRLRQRPEDFLVEEVPLYEPCGSGEHIYLFVEKREMSTMHLARLLAAHFGVRLQAVGYAGLKDKHAVTRQVMSVHAPGRSAADSPSIHHASVRVLWADRHTNKVRRGHLRGNRFSIRVRGVEPARVVDAARALAALVRDGAPNRVGAQRFGGRGNNHLVGLALVRGDAGAVADHLLAPGDGGSGLMEGVRLLYAQRRYREAIDACPRSARTERVVLGVLARGGTPEQAVRAIDRPERSFFVNALQSAIFNAVLDQRLLRGTLGSLGEGDLAFRHDNGAVFGVDAAVAADPSTLARLERLEISPSGPMWGPAMTRAGGAVDARELAALRAAGLGPDGLAELERWGGPGAAGARRPLRIPVIDPDVEGGVDEHGAFVRCAFELPRGAFATSVMQEIMKTDAPDATGEGHDDEP